MKEDMDIRYFVIFYAKMKYHFKKIGRKQFGFGNMITNN